MITYINNNNVGKYHILFNKASQVLQQVHDLPEEESSINSLAEYFAVLRTLADQDVKFLVLPLDEDTLDIDANSRAIKIPTSFSNGVGVQGDEIAEILYFTIDRYFDATDLANEAINIAIQWETSEGVQGVSKEFVRDVTSQPGKLIFGWPLISEITNKPGDVTFSVRFYTVKERSVDGNLEEFLTYNFNTLPATIKINSSLNYQLHGEGKQIGLDRTDFIKDRVVNTAPVEGSIPADFPLTWRKNSLSEGESNIKDLENGEYKIKVIADSLGTIVYNWYRFGDPQLDNLENINKDNSVGIDASNIEYTYETPPGNKLFKQVVYFKQVEENGVPAPVYIPFVVDQDEDLTSEGKYTDGDGNTFTPYAKYSTCTVRAPGVYFVTAHVQSGKIRYEDEIQSVHVVFYPPASPEIKAYKVDDDVKDSDEDTPIPVVVRENTTPILSVEAKSPELEDSRYGNDPRVELSYEWYYKEDENTPVKVGDTDNEIKIEGLEPNEDRQYFVEITNHRNGQEKTIESKAFRVTPPAAAPIIKGIALGENENDPYGGWDENEKTYYYDPLNGEDFYSYKFVNNYFDIEVTLTTDENEALTDNYTYQWKNVASIDSEELVKQKWFVRHDDDDIPIEGATSNTFVFNGDIEKATAFFYCEITNHLNGDEKVTYSPFFRFYKVDI